MESAMPEDFGPLPKFGRQAELERLSIKALNNLLPVDRFIFRGEHQEDAGVDGELEVLIAPNFTSYRAKVQLKATDDDKLNIDGSYSLNGVTVSSFFYLLNNPWPIYIVFIAPLNELRFAWAWEEFQRHEKEVSGWKKQSTITINFKYALDLFSLDQIRVQIIQRSNFIRQAAEILSGSGNLEQVSLHVNTDTLAITDSNEIRELLLQSGMSLVGSGHARQVIDLTSLLSATDIRLPRIQVVLAYAQFTQSRLLAALGHIQNALLLQASLSAEDRDFLIFLRDACEHESGRISLAEYAKRKERWSETGQSRFSLIHKLECLGHELISDIRSERFGDILAQIRSVVGEIDSDSRSSAMLKLQAHLKLKYAEGAELIRSFISEIEIIHVRTSINKSPNPLATLNDILKRYLQWQESMEEKFQGLLNTNHYRLMGDMALTRGILQLNFLSTARIMNVPYRYIEYPAEMLDQAMLGVRLSVALYQRSGFLLGELRGKMLLTDFLVLAGKEDEAKALATETLPVAQAMDFPHVEDHIFEHIEGKSAFSNMNAATEKAKSFDADVEYASESDEGVRLFAKAMLTGMDLPAERLPIVERDCFAMREEARVIVSWCRHFELIQDLRHTARQETQYAKDLLQFGSCGKHRISSGIGHLEASVAIEEFKQGVCSGCPDRSPKRTPPNDLS